MRYTVRYTREEVREVVITADNKEDMMAKYEDWDIDEDYLVYGVSETITDIEEDFE